MGRVLVIDDDPVMRGTIRKILEREGHEVRETGSSREGLTHFRKEPAEVVVTDLNMPDKEGVATIVELRNEAPDARILAILSDPTVLAETELSGAETLAPHASLRKPFTIDQLRHAVSVLLS